MEETTPQVIEVEQVVITATGQVFRNENAKRRVAAQKALGHNMFARLSLAKKEPIQPLKGE